MGLEIDWENELILVTSPTVNVDAQVLHDFIEDAMASAQGSTHEDIIQPEGKIEDPNNPGVFSQIIIILNSPWQIQFWGGSGYTRIYGGKLVGGLGGEPFKATGTAGDITVLESPVDGLTVVSGSGVTPQDVDDIADAVWNEAEDEHVDAGSMGYAQRLARFAAANGLEVSSGDPGAMVLRDDAGNVALTFQVRGPGGGPVALPGGYPAIRGKGV
jgi:hypothetical protein